MDEDQEPPSTTAVLKFGGEVVADPERLLPALRDVERLRRQGWRFVLCHGAGPQAGGLSERLGLPTRKVAGYRVTDPETLQVMKFALAGEANVDVTAAAVGVGLRALGVSGVAGLVRCRRRPPLKLAGESADLGWVGEIEAIDERILSDLLDQDFVPVVSSLGIECDGGEAAVPAVYNVNADTVACAIAAALRADHLFLLTAVGGVRRDPDDAATRLPRLSAAEAEQAIADGWIAGGMVAKVKEALEHLDRGVGAIHVLGSEAGSLQRAAGDPGSVGTVLIAS